MPAKSDWTMNDVLQQPSPDQWAREKKQLEARIAVLEQAEVAFERVRRQNELLLRAAGEGLCGLDTDGRITFVNPAGARMLGYDADDLIGEPYHPLIHYARPDGAPYPDDVCPILLTLRDGQSRSVDDEMFWQKDGTGLPVSYVVTALIEADAIVGAVIAYRDITPHKQAQAALATERSLLRTVIDYVPDYVYVKDRDGHYLLQNKANLALVGAQSMDDVIGKTAFDLYPESFAEQVTAADQSVLDSGVSLLNMDLPLVDAQGGQHTVLATRVPLRDDQGRVIGLVGIGRDITERKRAEDALAHYAKRLDVLHMLHQGVLAGQSAESIGVDVLRGFCRLVPCHSVSLALFDFETDEVLVVIVGGGGDLVITPGRRVTSDDFRLPADLQRRRQVIINDLADPTFTGERSLVQNELSAYGTHAYISTPLVVEDRLLGELGLGDNTPGAFGVAHRVIAMQLADQLAIAVSHVRLREQVQRHNVELQQRVIERTSELERTRSRVEAILNNSSDAIILARPDGTISQTNLTFDRLFRSEPDDLFHRSLTELVHHESVPALTQAIQVVTEEGAIQQLEIVAQRKDGTFFDAELALSLIRTTAGQRGGIVCHLRDITERKRAEAATRESEARYRELFEGIDDVIFVHDVEGRLLAVNEAASRRLDYTRAELLHMKTSDIDAPEYAADFEKRVTQQFTQGSMKERGGIHVTKAGRRIYVDVNSKIITYQGQAAVLSVYRDITEQLQMERALGESEDRFRSLFEHAPVSLWEADFSGTAPITERLRAEGVTDFLTYFHEHTPVVHECAQQAHVLQVNRATLELFQAEYKANLMRSLDDLWSDNSLELLCKIFTALGEGLTRFEHEAVLQTLSGVTIFTVVGLSVAPVAEQSLTRVLLYVVDITARKQAEEELLKALEKERELNDLKTRFVSMASHEFRTPLTTIVSSTEILQRYNDRMAPDQKQKHFGKVQSASHHMTQLLDDVLLVGRSEAGHLQFDPAPLDLTQFVLEAIEQAQVTAPETLNFDTQFDGACGSLMLDEKLLRHMLTNLLSNAVKYSPEGGTIHFAMQCSEAQVMFRVQDEGIGIPEKDQARLFEPFHRADNVDTIQGTGLGLAITKHAVDRHGGMISFESTVGKGTVFTVVIPIPKSGDTRSEGHDQDSSD